MVNQFYFFYLRRPKLSLEEIKKIKVKSIKMKMSNYGFIVKS